MGAGNNTKFDIGIRRNISGLGYRNFDPAAAKAGSVIYISKYTGPTGGGLWWVDGNHYTYGQNLPYDLGTSPEAYTAKATSLLNFYWEQDFIYPNL
jgi:hypothetical protein